MKNLFAGTAIAAASLAFATGALAVGPPYNEDHAVPNIVAPSTGAAACQTALAKNSQKYVKSLLKIRSKCLTDSISDNDVAACPNDDDDEKALKAANKSLEKIAEECGTTTGLGNGYSGASAADVGSCTLSQNHSTVEIFIGETHGEQAGPIATDCQIAINKASNKLLPTLVKTAVSCIENHLKDGDSLNLGAKCVGSSTTLVVTQPTDVKTGDKFNKSIIKAWDQITPFCETLSQEEIRGLYGCPGANTFDDLQQCVEASALNATYEIIAQDYAEDASVIVQPGAAAIQTAVTAAGAGDKILIASGTYAEGVVIPGGTCSVSLGSCPGNKKCSAVSKHPGTACNADEDCYGTCGSLASNAGAECTVDGDCSGDVCQVGTCVDSCTGGGGDTCVSAADDLQIVGCGAATNQRPAVIPPAIAPPNRGFLAVGVDGLHFQGLEVTGWQNDGIFVSGAAGVSFRDIYGNGDNLSTANVDAVSTYAIFPVQSTNVVVEGSEVVNVRDAGIYVGQSEGVVMRHNNVHACVSGMELENSKDGIVYGNVTHGNTGGLLVFKLPGPEHQVAGGHSVFDNLSYSNNVPNFAIPGTTVSAVPRGTGMMVISDDDSVYENNRVQQNDAYGMLILDQEAVNILVPGSFVPTSYDQDSSNLTFLNNFLPNGGTQNGTGVEEDEFSPYSGNWTWAVNTGPLGTCWDPVPTSNANAILGNSSFPACP